MQLAKEQGFAALKVLQDQRFEELNLSFTTFKPNLPIVFLKVRDRQVIVNLHRLGQLDCVKVLAHLQRQYQDEPDIEVIGVHDRLDTESISAGPFSKEHLVDIGGTLVTLYELYLRGGSYYVPKMRRGRRT